MCPNGQLLAWRQRINGLLHNRPEHFRVNVQCRTQQSRKRSTNELDNLLDLLRIKRETILFHGLSILLELLDSTSQFGLRLAPSLRETFSAGSFPSLTFQRFK